MEAEQRREVPEGRLAVVVVNWNGGALLSECLRSVQAAAAGLEPDIVLVDNASTDGSVAEAVISCPGLRVVQNQENLGFARAVNIGVGATRSSFVAVLNPDLVMPAGPLDRMLAFLGAGPERGLVGPTIVKPDGEYQCGPQFVLPGWSALPLMGKLARRWRLGTTKRSSDGAVACDFVHGSCFMVRRSALEAVGGVPEVTFMYGEEALLGRRLRRAGGTVWYLPTEPVLHYDDACADQRWTEEEKARVKAVALMRVQGELLSRPGYAVWWAVFGLRTLAHVALGRVGRAQGRALLGEWRRRAPGRIEVATGAADRRSDRTRGARA